MDQRKLRSLAGAVATTDSSSSQADQNQSQTSVNPRDIAACGSVAEHFNSLWLPVIESKCISCHTSSGSAHFSKLLFEPASSYTNLAKNFALLKSIAAETGLNGQSLLIAKPTLSIAHGGGKVVSPGSKDFEAIQNFVSRPPSDSDILCGAAAAAKQPEVKDPILDDKDMAVSRLLRRVSLAVRGTLPSVEEYSTIREAPATIQTVVETMLNQNREELYDRVHKHVIQKVLPGLVREAYTLGHEMLGLGIEIRNQLSDRWPDPFSRTRGKFWNFMKGQANKTIEPAIGCKRIRLLTAKTEQEALTDFEHFSSENWPLADDFSECVLEAPAKTMMVEYRKYMFPGFSASFGPQHPRWAEREALLELMQPWYAITEYKDKPGEWTNTNGLGQVGYHRAIATRSRYPWSFLQKVEHGSSLFNGLGDAYWYAILDTPYMRAADGYVKRYLVLQHFNNRLDNAYRWGDYLSRLKRQQLEQQLNPITGPDENYIYMAAWMPAIDEYPDIFPDVSRHTNGPFITLKCRAIPKT